MPKISILSRLANGASQAKSFNEQFQEQREILADFYAKFYGSLKKIIAELEGEIITLRLRHFDHKMLQLLNKLQQDLMQINQQTTPEKPYIGAEQLVQLILTRPNKAIVDNLDFLAKHHLASTNIEFTKNKHLQHPQMKSLDAIKSLAEWSQLFMTNNPLIQAPTPSTFPPGLEENMKDIPAFTATPEEATKPGIPKAKK